jgi:hypothetical protein
MSFANTGLQFTLSSMWEPTPPVLSLEGGYSLSPTQANTQIITKESERQGRRTEVIESLNNA